MTLRSTRIRLVWPVAATALFACTVALADENDPKLIEQQLVALEAKPEQKTLVAAPVAKARKALARVKMAQAAGDAPQASALAMLAKEYADVAAAVVRAAALEHELETTQARIVEVEQKRRRTETLIEETIAQRERARQELKTLSAEKAQALAEATEKAKTDNKAKEKQPLPAKKAVSK